MRLTDDEMRERTGKSYAEWLTGAPADTPIALDTLMRFNETHAISKAPRLDRLHREMQDDASGLRAYLRDNAPRYDRALSLDMDLRALRDVLQAYESYINDSSHGWYSSTPLNIVLFHQLETLTGMLCWKLSGASATKPGKKQSLRSEDETTQCVYAIMNYADPAPHNGPKVYIGRTGNLARRMRQHAAESSTCTLVRNAIQTYGIHNMVIKVLVVGTGDSIRRSETTLIAQYNSMFPNGYNLRCGDTASETAYVLTTRDEVVDMQDLSVPIQFEAQSMVLEDVRHIASWKEPPPRKRIT